MKDLKESGHNNYNYFDFDFNSVIKSIGILFASFVFLFQHLILRNYIKRPTVKRMKKAYFRGSLTLIFIYLLIPICSYLSLGDFSKTKDMALLRKAIGTDYIMKTFRYLLLIGILVAGSLIMFSFKSFLIGDVKKASHFKNIGVTLILIGSIIGLILMKIDVTFGLTIAGLIGGNFVGFTFPFLLAWKS